MYTLNSGETIDIRINGKASVYESCWAQVQDVSVRRSKPNLQAGAREEQVKGDTLEDFQQTIARPQPFEGWLYPAGEVAGKDVFLLNVSDKPTVLAVCAARALPDSPVYCVEKPALIPVSPKQTVVLGIRNLHRPYLLIQSAVKVDAIFGFLRPESGIRRTFSTESSIDFNDPSRQ
jgi:hypothetical protein